MEFGSYSFTPSTIGLLIGSISLTFILIPLIYLLYRLFKQNGRKITLAQIDRMDGNTFEEFTARCFRKYGYGVERTPYRGDYGADLILLQGGQKTVVQVKRYKSNVGVKAIQEIVAARSHYRANKAMVVTNSHYTRQARTLAASNGVELWDREMVVRMCNNMRKPKSL
jgi:restriction system protein